jgi:acyl dehydratase
MTEKQTGEASADTYPKHPFKTARRTISETDIVNFVNLVGLHEPIFVDMEFIKERMNTTHVKRFAPAPLLISLGMGLLAPHIEGVLERVLEGHRVGLIGGMTGVQARVHGPAFPGDTLQVEGEAWIREKVRRGHTLVDLRHRVMNQHGVMVVDFTETVMFMPPAD